MEQSAIWNEVVGDAWVDDAALIDAHSEAFGAAAMDALGDIAGRSVLDVGCGTGTTTLELARRGAHATGVDLSQPMIDHARRRPVDEIAGTVSFECADITRWSGAQPFDAVFSRFGVMFFDDATNAFGHLRSLTNPGGRLAFCAWTDPFSNSWMSIPVMASIAVLGPPQLPAPTEPGPFLLGDPERVQSVLAGTGWTDVSTRDVTITDAPHPAGDADHVATSVIRINPVLALPLREHPELEDDLHRAVADALREQERDGVVHLTASALVVSAVAG